MMIFSLLLVSLRLILAAKQCYNPDGSLADDTAGAVPCSPDAEDSFCCAGPPDGPTDMCSTNGMCKSPTINSGDNYWWRSSCTDPTFQSPSCTRHCFDNNTDPHAGSGNWVAYQCSETTYCCAYQTTSFPFGPNYACCNNASRVFDAGPALYLAGPSVSLPSFWANTLSSSRPASSATASPSSALSTTLGTTTSVIASPSSSASSSSLSPGAAAGLGVGVSLSVMALIGIIFLLWKRKRRSSLSQIIQQGGQGREDMGNLPPAYYAAHEKHEPVELYTEHPEADPSAALVELYTQHPKQMAANPNSWSELEGHPVRQ